MIGQILIIAGVSLLITLPILRILNRIEQGIALMADLEASALADIAAAIDAAVALIEKLAAAAATAVPPVDHSADIEALKKKLSDAVTAASAPAPAAPAPAAPSA